MLLVIGLGLGLWLDLVSGKLLRVCAT